MVCQDVAVLEETEVTRAIAVLLAYKAYLALGVFLDNLVLKVFKGPKAIKEYKVFLADRENKVPLALLD